MVFAASLGLSLSTIFLVYTGASITRVFFISAAAFGGLSLWGYTTQRDLSPYARFFIMGLIGVVIASVVNMFLASTQLQWLISVVSVLVFAGSPLGTRSHQRNVCPMDDGTHRRPQDRDGPLRLYLDFINLFLSLLRLFGDRR